MKGSRRHLVAGAALAGAPALSAAAQAAPQFKLRYAPRVGWMGNMTVPQQLEMYAQAGFRAFEHNGLPTQSMSEIEAIRRKRDELKMSMGVFVVNRGGWRPTSLPDKSGHARLLEDVRRAVEIYRVMENECATITSGLGVPHLTFAQQTQNCIEGLKRCAEIVEKTKMVLVLEPLNHKVDHAGYFVVYSEHAGEIIAGVNHPQVKILFDMYHQQISEGNIINHIDQYEHLIGYYQTGDVPGRREPYTGEMNYQNIFRHLHRKGYKGLIGLEHGMSQPGPEGFRKVVDSYRKADDFTS
ncbi:MAG TPA: TIM barrel protein [Bryobacteraceae bacterium]|nr:TIM barrel protein [Bryobacteraceae bacterium]